MSLTLLLCPSRNCFLKAIKSLRSAYSLIPISGVAKKDNRNEGKYQSVENKAHEKEIKGVSQKYGDLGHVQGLFCIYYEDELSEETHVEAFPRTFT